VAVHFIEVGAAPRIKALAEADMLCPALKLCALKVTVLLLVPEDVPAPDPPAPPPQAARSDAIKTAVTPVNVRFFIKLTPVNNFQ
jgi:hypothetical protein